MTWVHTIAFTMPSEEENLVSDVTRGIDIKLLNGRCELAPPLRMVVDQAKASRKLGPTCHMNVSMCSSSSSRSRLTHSLERG